MAFPSAVIGITALKKKLSQYVDRYDHDDKFVPVGFKVDFDSDFLRETWFAVGDKYGPGSYIFNCSWDIRADVAKMICRCGLRLPNYKLSTICEHFGISLKGAHDALVDIKGTRELALLTENYLRRN